MKVNSQIKLAAPEVEGFTLAETLVAMAIAGVTIAAMVGGFTYLIRSSNGAAYSLAANALAVQRYEQTRGARLDATASPMVDELVSSNFPPQVLTVDVPQTTGNRTPISANLYTTITTLSTNPMIKAVQIDCVYDVPRGGTYTNTIVSYRGSETGQQNPQPSAGPASPSLPPPAGTIATTNSRAGATNTAALSGTGTGWSQTSADNNNNNNYNSWNWWGHWNRKRR
jgi:type II secretory pathway pseudopilin PulG